MQIHDLRPAAGAKKRRKIVGRGPGSGHGKTSCRGQTGQNSRSGRGILNSLEGGQVPLIRRLPKVGFRSHRPVLYQLVDLKSLAALEAGLTLDAGILKANGLVRNIFKPYKIVGSTEINQALTVEAYSFSKRAQENITRTGGKAVVIDQQLLKKRIQANKAAN